MKNLKHKLIIALIIAIAFGEPALTQDVVPGPIRFLNMSGEAMATINGTAMNFSVNATIAGEDSLAATLLAMGMPVGKLFASENEYKIWNTMENTGYAGKDTKALSRLSGLTLGVRELVRVFRGLTPSDFSEYTLKEKQDGSALYIKTSEKGAVFARMGDRGEALQLQFKNAQNELIGNVVYENFQQFSAGYLAKTMKISAPKRNLSITITWTKIESIDKLTKAMNFLPPQSAEIINTDELLNEE